MRSNGNYGLLPNSSFKSRPDPESKKDTGAKERAVNAITGELVCTACCRLVNYYNCEVPAIFRLALVHQRYMPTYRLADIAQRLSNSGAGTARLDVRTNRNRSTRLHACVKVSTCDLRFRRRENVREMR